MTNLELLRKYVDALRSDIREDRYKVRAEIIEKCEEIIQDHIDAPDYEINLRHIHEDIMHECRDCSNTGHSASWFYRECAELLSEMRGLPKDADLASLAQDLIKSAAGATLPAYVQERVDALAAWFR